jgi:hypothetical protein
MDGEDVDDEAASMWFKSSAGLQLVARQGQQAPGAPPGVRFFTTEYTQFSLADNGDLTFMADVTTDGVPGAGTGIWRRHNGATELLSLSGQPAPGFPGEAFGVHNQVVANELGQIAFSVFLDSGIYGIWATDLSGSLKLIVAEGELLEVAPGDFRTVVGFEFVAGNGNDVPHVGFNNRGQLAFFAKFTDGSQGIFVSNLVAVPEPCSLLLLAQFVVLVIRPRRSPSPLPVPPLRNC